MRRLISHLKMAFRPAVYRRSTHETRDYLTAAERQAIMLTAEGNVCLAMGRVCTAQKVADMKKEILDYVNSRH